MNELDYDAMLKKRIARNYFRKKRNRRGCTLPSESLSKAQREKLNGDVIMVNLNEPITWEAFKNLSTDLQSEYYNHIIEKFGVGKERIAKMFGVSVITLRKHIKEKGINAKQHEGRTSGEKIRKFEEWRAQETSVIKDALNISNDQVNEIFFEEDHPEKNESCLSRYSFDFENVTGWEDILKFIKNMPLPENAKIQITVEGDQK